jgi:hypothetical protein
MKTSVGSGQDNDEEDGDDDVGGTRRGPDVYDGLNVKAERAGRKCCLVSSCFAAAEMKMMETMTAKRLPDERSV